MIICLRPGGRLLLGHGLRLARRRCRTPFPVRSFRAQSTTSAASFRSAGTPFAHPYVTRLPRSRAKYIPCPVPHSERTDIAKWIPFLDRYLPPNLRESATALPEVESQSEPEQCQAILHLLFQARSSLNYDLLTYMGFKQNRWEAVKALVDKLLDNTEELRSKHQDHGCLPSNIDWGSLGPSFNTITGDGFYPDVDIPFRTNADLPPLASYDMHSEEPVVGGRMGEANLRIGTMEELWPFLGYFVIEAADMPPEKASLIMHHFYYIVARLHNLDYIPKNVYKDVPNQEFEPPGRVPVMHLLSTRILSILTDAMLERYIATDQPLKMELLRSSERQLGFGIWLEFILWCCVEGGYAREAAWILEMTRKSSNGWKVASFAPLLKETGPIDPRKIDHYDTWAECGQVPETWRLQKPKGPFLGMGERTITQEVVLSVMDGLVNAVRAGVSFRGDSANYVWERLGLLRGILNKNHLYVHSGLISYLIVRILEAGGIVLEVKPQALELILDSAPYIATADELDIPLETIVELLSKGHIPSKSAVTLGLYHYVLNAYASSGHVSGTIDVLEKLVAAVDPEKVHMIRDIIMEPKYLTKTHNIRRAGQRTSTGTESLDTTGSTFAGLQIPSSSLSLILSTLTDSKVFSLASWILNPREMAGPIIPTDMYSDEILAPAIIRYATMTNDAALFFNLLGGMPQPWPRSIIHPMLDFRLASFRWKQALELMIYLRDVARIQWDPTNIATLAAAIIRLDQPHDRLSQFTAPEGPDSALVEGRSILIHFLEGHFDAPEDFSEGRNHLIQQTTYQFHRVFQSINSPSLSEVCKNAKPVWQRPEDPPCYIPADAFRILLAAVVEVHGSPAGKRLYDRWCMLSTTPRARHIDSGGNTRLFYSKQLNQETGGVDPDYDSRLHTNNRGKIVMPDLTIVRTIALGALQEQTDLAEKNAEDMASSEITPETVTAVLDWCLKAFVELGLTDREINRELDGYLTRLKKRLRQEKEALVARGVE